MHADPDQPTELEPGVANAVGTTLGLLGDEWTLLLLQQSLLGATRYSQFQTALPISNATLTARLATLIDHGLLEHSIYEQRPLRAAYLPTQRSRSLWPFLVTIWDWERNWVPAQAQRLPRMVHTKCGHDSTPVSRCATCEQLVAMDGMAARWGPSGSWERSVPRTSTRRRRETPHLHGKTGLFPDTMTVIGNRWSAGLISACLLGLGRFAEFERALGVPPAVLTERLRAFTESGVLTADSSSEEGPAYRLTLKGYAFLPVLLQAVQWGQRWFHAPEGEAVVFTHLPCGSPLVTELGCSVCGELIHGGEIAVMPLGSDEPDPGAEAPVPSVLHTVA